MSATKGKVVDRMCELKAKMGALQNEYQELELELIDEAQAAWASQELAGVVTKTWDIRGQNGAATITRRDAWHALNAEQLELFELLLPETIYQALFVKATSQRLTGSMDALIVEAEAAGVNVHRYFTVTHTTKPAKGFTERLAGVKYQLRPEDRAELDALVRACRYKPAVVTK